MSIAFEIETPVNTELNARTSGGSVIIENLSGNQYARTLGGSMDANNIQGNIEMRTFGGTVTVKVPESLGYDLELTGSRIRTEFRNFTGSSSKDAIKGSMNGGGIPLKARTSHQEALFLLNIIKLLHSLFFKARFSFSY